MKAIVAGGRNFLRGASLNEISNTAKWLRNTLQVNNVDTIISGMCRGADMFGLNIAFEEGMEILEFPADWVKYGKKAGYLRNQQMSKHADIVILFPGGKGTEHMENISKLRGLKIIKYKDNNNE